MPSPLGYEYIDHPGLLGRLSRWWFKRRTGRIVRVLRRLDVQGEICEKSGRCEDPAVTVVRGVPCCARHVR